MEQFQRFNDFKY